MSCISLAFYRISVIIQLKEASAGRLVDRGVDKERVISMKVMKMILLVIVLSMLMVLTAGMVSAAYADESGTYNALTWKYTTADQTLELAGSGYLPNDQDDYPWSKYKDEIKIFIVKSGVEGIQEGAVNFPNVELIKIPYNIELGYDPGWYDEEPPYDAFTGCNKDLVQVEITGTDDVLSTKAAEDLGDWGYYIKGYGWSMSGIQNRFKYSWIDSQEHADNGTIIAEKQYTGKKIKPSPELWRESGADLYEGLDYTLSYQNNINVGTAYVIVKGKGEYYGQKKLRFVIYPKSTSIKKVVSAKKAFTVKWKKQDRKMKTKHITGYIVRYSRDKNFGVYEEKIIQGYKKTSKKIKGLKSKQTYYVKVRPYYKDSEDEYRAKWSKRLTVKTK